jgi:two-component system sensor histidine kinase UhpB
MLRTLSDGHHCRRIPFFCGPRDWQDDDFVRFVRGSLARGGIVGAATALGQLLSVALWTPVVGTHMVWFPGAILLAALLAAPKAQWPACIVGQLIGIVVTGLAFGLHPVDMLTVVTLPALLTVAVAWALLRWRALGRPLDEFRQLWWFLFAILVLSALGAALVAWTSGFTRLNRDVLGAWSNIALAHALADVVCVPLYLSIAWRPDDAVRYTWRRCKAWFGVAALIVVGMAWWWLSPLPGVQPVLLLAPVPLLLWSTYRYGVLGACVSMFLVTVAAAWCSLHQHGPFLQSTAALTTLSVQAWALALTVAALILAVSSEQRRAIRRALASSHNEIRELAGRLIVAREHERVRIAGDLQDDIDQQVAMISSRLDTVRRRLAHGDRADLDMVHELVAMLSEDIRRVSHELHPSRLGHTGLHEALRSLCESQQRQGNVHIELDLPKQIDDYRDQVAQALFFTTREALDNAATRASTARIDIRLLRNFDDVVLGIDDDGAHWDPKAQSTLGLGLLGMAEQARLLGGELTIESAPGKGCRVRLRLPLGGF